ncbi:PREDICTED: DNA-directed RNA polymerase I subunit RPA2 isoform X2 [Trachymyrmex cornetzi]|uniref:DNA-directed RNA polymerase I subunit RPA2 isoform X2 n=1 Tax=Trachymyrmex cornetzi TaxID=471704 RepID=UPI00084F6D51|nr:PREDICTED: DNA-directed RNA polymerase I subunit RPA2 isoform X2 [Trachymyrmex cornetzi]
MSIGPKLTNTSPNFGIPPDKQNELLQSLGVPHIDSFNYMLEDGLFYSLKDCTPVYLTLTNGDKVVLWMDDVHIYKPTIPSSTIGVKTCKIYPTECRQRGSTYKGKIIARLGWSVNGKEQELLEKDLGEVPIMVKSNRCNLNNMNPEELIAHGEHEQEWGGYFIIRGLERLIRMLIMTRRNYPIAVKRPTWKGRGDHFSELGILLRSVREDNSSINNTLHFVTDGSAKLAFTYKKVTYFVPLILILKCLIDVTDLYIYKALIAGCEDDLYYKNNIINMLRAVHEEGLHWHEQCKAYIGKMFKVKCSELSTDATNIDVCDYIIKYCISIHLEEPTDKFHLLVFMTKKLFTFANNKCAIESADAVMMQECLLGGHLYLQVLKEKLYSWLVGLKHHILKRDKSAGNRYALSVQEMLNVTKFRSNIDSQMEYFLSTGNVRSSSGLGLMQTTGFTIVVENINRMRYMSHFRAIHRGAFFQEMRTTEARQLLPDAWGFICPIHTPDGAPCGLLNHLTMNCIITKHANPKLKAAIPAVLVDHGMIPLSIADDWKNSYNVMLDGKLIGLIEDKIINKIVYKLRLLKIKGREIPSTLEIAFVPKKNVSAQYPGLFLFTNAARMMRPVINLAMQKIELIGTFEQIYMEICVNSQEAYEGLTTHQEISQTTIFSNLANLIPLPDCNQSPRNMYQCQGYDMEDAMVINKSAYERGFGHGTIYKSEFVDLNDKKSYFARDPERPDLEKTIDIDGLPRPRIIIKEGDAYYSYYDTDNAQYVIGRYRSTENAYIDNVKLCGILNNQDPRRACITFRIPRNPTVGDKFASRAGQKGILSRLYPVEDLPFSETGMVPDIIFNPHGFPSRMTIAMMIEVMAGKSAAIHGLVHDATPFRFDEESTAVDYFGELLELGGYNYYGTERMYSGIYGCEMNASIFFGIVHYQRLRHMVSDKWQVRSTGPIDLLTRQPIKGRRRGGGIRFGEMERDALISHGCSYLLQDRLFHCSDKITTLACHKCGSLLGPELIVTNRSDDDDKRCRLCGEEDTVDEIEIPYIFKFLLIQLASCNINIKLKFRRV